VLRFYYLAWLVRPKKEGQCMSKRIVCISVLVLVILLPLTAAPVQRSPWSAGVSIGTSAQGVVWFQVNDYLDISAGLGIDFFTKAIYGDVDANFRVWKFNIQEEYFDLTVGGGVLFGLYDEQLELSLFVPVGVYYSFAEDVLPLDVYFHMGPSFRLLQGYQPERIGFYSYVGAVYRF